MQTPWENSMEQNETMLGSTNRISLEKFKLYETQTKYYLIGRDKARSCWKLLKVDRSQPSELIIDEDPAIYTEQDCKDFLARLAEGNRSCGGLNFVTKAYGIVGFIKFLKPYYMILITKRQLLGVICGHYIFGICESRLLRVPHPSVLVDPDYLKSEERYKRLFNLIDLSKGFFYSYTYGVMWSLQKNVNAEGPMKVPYGDMFVWNSFLTRVCHDEVKSAHWTVALVHGFFKQVKVEYEGSDVTLTLIARRSRHFAGTRYLKRGVNAKGRVANDVETEQLIYAEKADKITSIVQHRGSIPLYWSQETSVLSPKPDIILHKNAPTYEATRRHFENLVARYGNPIFVLNLVKTQEKRPRESILSREYANAIAYLNHTLPKSSRIKFIQCDMQMFVKRKSPEQLQEVLESIATEVLEKVGLYCSDKACDMGARLKVLENHDDPQVPPKMMLQRGVLRTNCIDCLDRTNVSQYAFGLVALGQQMHALGFRKSTKVGRSTSLATKLMELYERMGDVIAMQYGGSMAHNKVFLQWQGKSTAAIQSQELFRSLLRHYNNTILDGDKQDAINIFLGHFRPEASKLALWQMDSDNHLQIRRTADDPTSDLRLSFRRSFSAGNMVQPDGTVALSMDKDARTGSDFVKRSLKAGGQLSMEKRGSTISEAELKKCLADSCAVRHDEGDSCLLARHHSSMYKSMEASLAVHDVADADWQSSSGNSLVEDVQERSVVSAPGSESGQGSGLLSIRSQDGYEDDDYFQDFTLMFMAPKSQSQMLSEEGKDSGICTEDCLEPFSQRFVHWIQEGETLCF